MQLTTYEQNERAAIIEFDAGFSRQESEVMALEQDEKDMDRSETITKQQLDTLNMVKKSQSVLMENMDKNQKISIRQLINKKLLKIDKDGWVTPVVVGNQNDIDSLAS